MANEKGMLKEKKGISRKDLKEWHTLTVNRDKDGKILMTGNHTMTAVGLGMIA